METTKKYLYIEHPVSEPPTIHGYYDVVIYRDDPQRRQLVTIRWENKFLYGYLPVEATHWLERIEIPEDVVPRMSTRDEIEYYPLGTKYVVGMNQDLEKDERYFRYVKKPIYIFTPEQFFTFASARGGFWGRSLARAFEKVFKLREGIKELINKSEKPPTREEL